MNLLSSDQILVQGNFRKSGSRNADLDSDKCSKYPTRIHAAAAKQRCGNKVKTFCLISCLCFLLGSMIRAFYQKHTQCQTGAISLQKPSGFSHTVPDHIRELHAQGSNCLEIVAIQRENQGQLLLVYSYMLHRSSRVLSGHKAVFTFRCFVSEKHVVIHNQPEEPSV